MSLPNIDVIIVYGEDIDNYYKTFERAIKKHDGWMIIQDHDTMMCHPYWYRICQRLIENHPDAGCITCMTNRTVCLVRNHPDAPATENIIDHISFAGLLWMKYGLETIEVKNHQFSGPMLIINRKVLDQLPLKKGYGIFMDDWLNVELMKAGYKRYVAKGLYIYHLYNLKKKYWTDKRWKVN